jgi:hypothetical protein
MSKWAKLTLLDNNFVYLSPDENKILQMYRYAATVSNPEYTRLITKRIIDNENDNFDVIETPEEVNEIFKKAKGSQTQFVFHNPKIDDHPVW